MAADGNTFTYHLLSDPGAPICGHSGFWQRPEYNAAVDAVESTVLPEHTAAPATRATAPPMEQFA